MLSSAAHQAAGLMELAAAQSPRLMAMACHGDEATELPVLWRLCAALVDFGYTVTVLDATSAETEANQGLEQLLEYSYWQSRPSQADTPEWNVIPAALGLQTLCAQPGREAQNLALLGRLFPHEGVVLLYGKASVLTPLLARTTIRPLLAVAPVRKSLLTSYLALKHLLLKGGLEPTVISLFTDHNSPKTAQLETVANNLSNCARTFLDYEVKALPIATPMDEERPCVALQQLALRMLENAMPLHNDFAYKGAPPQALGTHHFSGSH